MTQKLINRIISYYEFAVNKIEQMDEICDIHGYLNQMGLDIGICFCSNLIFGEDIYGDEWIESKFQKGMMYFCEIPKSLNTKTEILLSLNKRIEIMKTFPN